MPTRADRITSLDVFGAIARGDTGPELPGGPYPHVAGWACVALQGLLEAAGYGPEAWRDEITLHRTLAEVRQELRECRRGARR